MRPPRRRGGGRAEALARTSRLVAEARRLGCGPDAWRLEGLDATMDRTLIHAALAELGVVATDPARGTCDLAGLHGGNARSRWLATGHPAALEVACEDGPGVLAVERRVCVEDGSREVVEVAAHCARALDAGAALEAVCRLAEVAIVESHRAGWRGRPHRREIHIGEPGGEGRAALAAMAAELGFSPGRARVTAVAPVDGGGDTPGDARRMEGE